MSTNTNIKMHSVLTNIPEEFVVEMGEGNKTQYLVRLGGLMFLANQMGKPILQTKNVSTKADEIVYECTGYLVPNDNTLAGLGIEIKNLLTDPRVALMLSQPTIAHGTTNGQNLKPNMLKYAEVMAETRAIVRCLRLLTGCSYTAVEEMDSSDLKGGFTVTTAADLYAKETMGKATTREDQIKELMTVMNTVPYSAIIQRYYKDNKATTFSDLKDEVVADLYGKVMMVLQSKK